MYTRLAIALLLAPCLTAQAAAPLEVESDKGMVVSSQHLATDAGAAILRQGGNAIDAAGAGGYGLAGTHPGVGNLCGRAFMAIDPPDRPARLPTSRANQPLAPPP